MSKPLYRIVPKYSEEQVFQKWELKVEYVTDNSAVYWLNIDPGLFHSSNFTMTLDTKDKRTSHGWLMGVVSKGEDKSKNFITGLGTFVTGTISAYANTAASSRAAQVSLAAISPQFDLEPYTGLSGAADLKGEQNLSDVMADAVSSDLFSELTKSARVAEMRRKLVHANLLVEKAPSAEFEKALSLALTELVGRQDPEPPEDTPRAKAIQRSISAHISRALVTKMSGYASNFDKRLGKDIAPYATPRMMALLSGDRALLEEGMESGQPFSATMAAQQFNDFVEGVVAKPVTKEDDAPATAEEKKNAAATAKALATSASKMLIAFNAWKRLHVTQPAVAAQLSKKERVQLIERAWDEFSAARRIAIRGDQMSPPRAYLDAERRLYASLGRFDEYSRLVALRALLRRDLYTPESRANPAGVSQVEELKLAQGHIYEIEKLIASELARVTIEHNGVRHLPQGPAPVLCPSTPPKNDDGGDFYGGERQDQYPRVLYRDVRNADPRDVTPDEVWLKNQLLAFCMDRDTEFGLKNGEFIVVIENDVVSQDVVPEGPHTRFARDVTELTK